MLDVVPRFETGIGRLAPAPHFRVVLFGVAGRHVVRDQVWQAQLNVAQLRLDFLQLAVARFETFAQLFDGSQEGLDVLALRFRLADTLGIRVALVLQSLRLDLQ